MRVNPIDVAKRNKDRANVGRRKAAIFIVFLTVFFVFVKIVFL